MNLEEYFLNMFEIDTKNLAESLKQAKEEMDKLGDNVNLIIRHLLNDSLNKKEVIEICHAGKFITVLGDKIQIKKKTEAPDFIIEYNGKEIGLEVERILNPHEVQNIKSKQELFEKAAKEFESKFPSVKLLANFWLQDGFRFKGNQKNMLTKEIVNFIHELASGNNPPYPIYIENVDLMSHSGVSFNFNEGAYMLSDLPTANLLEAITKKEAKVENYKINSGLDSHWLLLVSGIGSESFNIEDVELPQKIESQFEHIYLLEDFDAKVTKIK